MRIRIALIAIVVTLAASISADAAAPSRYQSLLATSAGRDTLLNLALWEDGRVTGKGKLFAYATANNPLVRLRAVEVIGRIQDPTDVPHLVGRLHDDDPRVISEAVFALGQMQSQAGVAPLINRLPKSDIDRTIMILEALGKIGGPQALEQLNESLHHFQARVRGAAVMGLAIAADETMVNSLLIAVHDGDAGVCARAIYALEKVESDRVADTVRDYLDHDDPIVRAYAARTLGKQKDRKSASALIARTHDDDLRVVINAINALALILENRKDENAVNALGNLLSDSHSHHVRKAAVMALGSIGYKGGKDYLAQSVLDRDVGVRAESYKALALVLDEKAAVYLASGLQDSELTVRVTAIEAVGIARDKDRLPFLIKLARDDNEPRVRAAAVRGLSHFDKDDVEGILIEKLADADWVVATEAVTALGEVDAKDAVTALMKTYETRNRREDVDLHIEILRVLTDFEAEQGQMLAINAIENSDKRIRLQAVALLEAVGAEPPAMAPDRAFYEADFNLARRNDLSLPFGRRLARIKTSRGEFEIELFGDDAIQTAANFIKLAEAGFYNDLDFHRVVPNFVVQGGDPRGDGWGDPGYNIRSEFNQFRYDRGYVGIAHAGKDTGGCQFFITHTPQPHLNGRYTIFGHVTSGMDVVDRIAVDDKFEVKIVE